MLQRIQTIYLFAAAIFVALMLVFPLGYYAIAGGDFVLKAFGISTIAPGEEGMAMIMSTPILGAGVVLTLLIPLVTIFLYKNRKLQNRLCIIEIVLLLALLGFAFYRIFDGGALLAEMFSGELTTKQSVFILAPLVSILFTVLAKRAIMKDEKLVRSMDRLR